MSSCTCGVLACGAAARAYTSSQMRAKATLTSLHFAPPPRVFSGPNRRTVSLLRATRRRDCTDSYAGAEHGNEMIKSRKNCWQKCSKQCYITETDISERKCSETGRKRHQNFGFSQAEQAIKAALLQTDGPLICKLQWFSTDCGWTILLI